MKKKKKMKLHLFVFFSAADVFPVVVVCPCWAPLLPDSGLRFLGDLTYLQFHIRKICYNLNSARDVLDKC